MKISTKGRYALRLMLDLASNPDDGYIALKDIAENQNISKKYLEQIVPLLNKAGFLNTNRGFQGGYRLARNPEEYTVLEILEVTEGSVMPVACLYHDPVQCERADNCATLKLWRGLADTISEYLGSVTLKDLLEDKLESGGCDGLI